MTRDEVIVAMCKIQRAVQRFHKYRYPADCFCGKNPVSSVMSHQNSGEAIAFIRDAVAEKIRRTKP